MLDRLFETCLSLQGKLEQAQAGLDPLDWKAMETVGAGVKEIRIRVETSYRVLYVAKFSEAVYVLHAFVKKTQKTSMRSQTNMALVQWFNASGLTQAAAAKMLGVHSPD